MSATATFSNQTARFAEFVESFRYEQIPAPVIERTKDVIYDGIGALLAATSPKYDIGPVSSALCAKPAALPNHRFSGLRCAPTA